MPSQNVTFDGTAPRLDDATLAKPEGASIVLALRDFLRARGWDPGDLDIFHGAWGLLVQQPDIQLLLVVTGPLMEGAGDWFLQIGYETPGVVARLFGRVETGTPEACLSLARHVNECLRSLGFTNLRWLDDGPPSAAESFLEPTRSR